MFAKYTYKKTKSIEKMLQRLEILKGIFDGLPIRREKEEQLRRVSLLKSSLFSAKIEGNRLRLEDLTPRGIERPAKEKEKREVSNIYKALHFIRSHRFPKQLSIRVIQKVHAIVMNGLSPDAGDLRREPSAIFNIAGVAVDMPPPPSEISPRLKDLIQVVNGHSNPKPITAALAHFTFEKIHPFLDGNGRVGRILSVSILYRGEYDFRSLLMFEEELEKNRQEYYDLLTLAGADITPFVEFFIYLLVGQAEKVIESIKYLDEEIIEDSLMPRRREILE